MFRPTLSSLNTRSCNLHYFCEAICGGLKYENNNTVVLATVVLHVQSQIQLEILLEKQEEFLNTVYVVFEKLCL